ncbi:helix-turn-helix domain-containing protein [Sphingomonas trueperi]|uniref:Transcriptional regulator with XRE-family HTH domain n=1 Tax=Sphingomonas trueperi TaxID=53317 RepID=A0A7X6BFI9_9SPHN|nr:helix-turn-helix transcriptional regulator [Sphingomonas trueperi]NJB99887.1 transcriptional regulator with XRE-family HTH domain [Sphingomonas trueperi]
MHPREWREGKGWTLERMAEELELADRSAVHRYETGVRRPAPDVLERYFLLTGGEVQPNDFYPLPRWRQRLGEVAEVARQARAAVLGKAA